MNPGKLVLTVFCFGWLLASLKADDSALDVKLTQLPDRVRVEVGGQLFTEYIYGDSANHPYCYPVLAADGTPMTRDFPMKKVAGEDTDHPWHRSLWFAHSMVNGVDFWNEGHGDTGHSPNTKGNIKQDLVLETSNCPVGLLRTHDFWVAPDGKYVCSDDRTIRFHATPAARMIDFEITIHALNQAPLVFGDNKDGTMAIRLAQWMTMPHKRQTASTNAPAPPSTLDRVEGHLEPPWMGRESGGGHILLSTGVYDKDTWGKRADWCDYYAKHNGKIYGVAIFDNPQNLRHPTWWQARDYGLLAANPFGEHDFEGVKDDPHMGDYIIPPEGSLTLRYRFYFHNGNPQDAKIADQYAAYCAEQ
jgi:hypothetical protein